MIRLETLSLGFLQVNGYIVFDDLSHRAVLIDPGDEADKVIAALTRLRLQPEAIMLTHAHVDHIRGVPELARRFAVPVYLHADDWPLYSSADNALPPWLPVAADLPEPVAAVPQPMTIAIQVLETPGHTPGGVCFYLPQVGWLFSGDTLFQQSIGRTDLPGGDTQQLLDSIHTKLLDLPPATAVFPGHGPATSIGVEKQTSPYLS